MGVQVAFNYSAWALRYPEFASVDPLLVEAYSAEATMYHRNDGGGPVRDAAQQAVLLNMATAHVCALNAALGGQPSPGIVGRVTNASEGSVSVAAQMDLPPGTAQWWAQTKYGAAYWTATAPFRTMRYRPGRPYRTNPWPFRG